MTSVTGKNVNARFLDASEEPNQVLLPIRGYAKEPLVALERAIEPIYNLLDDLDIMVDTAKKNCKKPTDGLNNDESAAIHLYTMQWEAPCISLYTMLNNLLRSERREPLKPWFRYLKLILTALYKLPSLRATIWRGISGNLSDQYNDEHIWWGFSSCTESVDVMEQFIGISGVRTLFNIECINGKAIRSHSFYKKENEILLLPGTYFRVVGKWSPAKDLNIIHLRETPPPCLYLEPPFVPTSPDVFVSSVSVPDTKSATPSSTATSTIPKKIQQFATPGTYKELYCRGRSCVSCGKCRDWYFSGDMATWKWIRNVTHWTIDVGKRWRNDRVWERFKYRDCATCRMNHALNHVHILAACLCEDNIVN